jgi:formate C-acetyltransferase
MMKQGNRLSAATHRLAEQYLSGEVGRSMGKADFSVAPSFYRQVPSADGICAEAIRLIALKSPVRILPGERIVGAATLKDALDHRIPLTEYPSISHTTIGFEQALKIGLRGYRNAIVKSLRKHDRAPETDFLKAMLSCLDSLKIWHGRYVAELDVLVRQSSGEEKEHYREVARSLKRVPEHPPRSFREAVQGLWLLWDFQRLCGNWSGIGRIDKMLGPLLKADLARERITLDEARELLAHFWIKGCEWKGAGHWDSGDAQFYQNIVLGGVDESGKDIANEVTDLVLDVVEELHISDFPIAVRLSRKTPARLLEQVARVQRIGGGIVAAYNEDRIIPALRKFGYPLKEARNFANDGCWELIVPGKTSFGYQPFDLLPILQETLGLNPGGTAPEFATFEALYADFRDRLARKVTALVNEAYGMFAFNQARLPNPLISIFVEDCIGRAKPYTCGGPIYTVLAPHAGGLADTADSLLAIQKLVYEGERRLSLAELVQRIGDDWRGDEKLRSEIAREFVFFGNDDEAADAMAVKVFNDYTGLVGKVKMRNGILRPAGLSTFGRESGDFLKHRTATATGRRKGEMLASNFSPSPGVDRRGPTAIIKSHCAADFSRLPCGTALDLKVLPASVKGEAGIQALVALMKTFVDLGGIFFQLDLLDVDMLRDAQRHPENYPNLAVRVSGWSARFATLSRNWQEFIISR